MSSALTVTAPEGLPFIDHTRVFDHPVAQVYGAYADPELIARWLGPRGYRMTVDDYDFRSGGAYRYTHTGPDGDDYVFRGSLHTVRENELIIQTFEYLGFPDVVSIESMAFEDLGDGRTRLSGHSVFPSLEARDGMLASDMETGMREGYDQLEELLREQGA